VHNKADIVGPALLPDDGIKKLSEEPTWIDASARIPATLNDASPPCQGRAMLDGSAVIILYFIRSTLF
jgi:hypothetical protein